METSFQALLYCSLEREVVSPKRNVGLHLPLSILKCQKAMHCLHSAPEIFQWLEHLWCSTFTLKRSELHGRLKTTVFGTNAVWVVLGLMNSCPYRHWGALKVCEETLMISTDHRFCPPFPVYRWGGVGVTAIEAPGWWDREVFLKGEEFHGICSFCCYGFLLFLVGFFSPRIE